MHGYRMRLLQELHDIPNSVFVTLTFDNPSLSRFSDNPNKSIRLFLDRLRKKYGKHIRHWFVAEFGKKHGRLHYHGLLFGVQMENEELEKLWKYGNTWVGYANDVTARYIVKYMTKNDTKGKESPRIITSFGIGLSWLNSTDCHIAKKQLLTHLTINGYPVPIPRYYIYKMYNKKELEKISYYLYMENVMSYYVGGTEYLNEDTAKYFREQKYKEYMSKGLVYYRNPSKRLNRYTKMQIEFDSAFENFVKQSKFFDFRKYSEIEDLTPF